MKTSATARFFIIVAQVLVIIFCVLGLMFLSNTNGATLFLFSAVGPGLVTFAVIMLAAVAIYSYQRRHSLFDYTVYKPGDFVFQQGEPGDCAYFIQSGEVEVLRGRTGQPPQVVAKLTQGQFFGESALIADELRNATVRAVSTTKLAVLGKENFLAMCKLLPSARQDIMKAFQERVQESQ